jgi:hypothetical protein
VSLSIGLLLTVSHLLKTAAPPNSYPINTARPRLKCKPHWLVPTVNKPPHT